MDCREDDDGPRRCFAASSCHVIKPDFEWHRLLCAAASGPAPNASLFLICGDGRHVR